LGAGENWLSLINLFIETLLALHWQFLLLLEETATLQQTEVFWSALVSTFTTLDESATEGFWRWRVKKEDSAFFTSSHPR